MIRTKFYFNKIGPFVAEGHINQALHVEITGEDMDDCLEQAEEILKFVKRERPKTEEDASDWSYSYGTRE